MVLIVSILATLSIPEKANGFVNTYRHRTLLPSHLTSNSLTSTLTVVTLTLGMKSDGNNKSNNPFFSMPAPLSDSKGEGNISMSTKDKNKDKEKEKDNMSEIEKEVLATTQAKLDLKRVKSALMGQGTRDITVDDIIQSDDNALSKSIEAKGPPPSQLAIALAAASFLGLLSFLTIHMPLLSLVVFLATIYVASRDPVNDEALVEGDISGPVTRIVGRATLESIKKTKPTMQRMVRAVASQDEYDKLFMKFQELENENQDLKQWVQQREAINDQAKNFTMDSLKDIARDNTLKVQLMTRLMRGA
eukprot:scaffold695_cov279-Chaetoceros_neogracile.AAC.62